MSGQAAKLRSANGGLSTLQRARSPLASADAQRALIAGLPLDARAADFDRRLEDHGVDELRAGAVEVLQVNLGKRCNQTCAHCHVDAGPERTESMSAATVDACLAVLERQRIPTLDITGGAPELHPEFERLVVSARALGAHVIDRCNLTLLEAPGGAQLAAFLARERVEVVASLPHYRERSTDRQRGVGVFQASISALRRLNGHGYGRDPERRLVLVTNPVGAFLPAGQASLEAEWKRELERLHGVRFDDLFTITNMPIARYLEWLERSGNLEAYMARLVDSFNPAAVAGLMCRTTLSVAWDGALHDCDFNQMLELGLDEAAPARIEDFDPAALAGRRIATGRHCFGCTAASGSSCGGALVEAREPASAVGDGAVGDGAVGDGTIGDGTIGGGASGDRPAGR